MPEEALFETPPDRDLSAAAPTAAPHIKSAAAPKPRFSEISPPISELPQRAAQAAKAVALEGTDKAETRTAELLKKTQRVPLDLVCPAGVAYEAQAMREGYIKYGYASFLDDSVKMSARACLAAAKRHIDRLLAGENKAPEPMATHHAGHARAMLGIYLECMEAGKLVDDRHPRHVNDNYIGRMYDRLAKENGAK